MEEEHVATFRVAKRLADLFDQTNTDVLSAVCVETNQKYGYIQMDVGDVRKFHDWLESVIRLRDPSYYVIAETAIVTVMKWYATNLNNMIEDGWTP